MVDKLVYQITKEPDRETVVFTLGAGILNSVDNLCQV